MQAAGRLGDKSLAPLDAHGCPACPHLAVTGPAVSGSPTVNTNKRPALRVGDRGIHSACCGVNTWVAIAGSATVYIDGKPAHRVGDVTKHCGGPGALMEGSPNVIVGGPPTVVEGLAELTIETLEHRSQHLLPQVQKNETQRDFCAYDDKQGNGVLAHLDENGFVNLYIKVSSSTPSGTQMFKEALNAMGPSVRGIRGTWLGGGDLSTNFDTYKANLSAGMPPVAAALRTFTGEMARRTGFTVIRVVSDNEDSVVVEFTR